jgi:tRNA wybutosine-synthesizing protein 3
VLTAALTAGFRESGAVSLAPSKNGEVNPIAAVRSTGYSFDSIIGYHDSSGQDVALVDEEYLRTLVRVANERFQINTERIARFREALLQQYNPQPTENSIGTASVWEDGETRKARKKAEGLARQQALKAQTESDNASNVSASAQDGLPNNMFD